MDTSTRITGPRRIRPSAAWYAVAAVVLVVGMLLTVRAAFDAADRVSNSYHELTPGTPRTIDLAAGDEQKVYAVWKDPSLTIGADRAGDDGGSGDDEAPERPPTTVTVTDPDGAPVDFEPSSGSSTSRWSIDERSGIVVGSFEVEHSGPHRITITFGGQPGGVEQPVKAAIGSFGIFEELRRVLAPVVLGFVVAMLLIVVTAIARGRAKRRRRMEGSAAATGSPGTVPGGARPDRRPPPPPPALPSTGSGDGPISFH